MADFSSPDSANFPATTAELAAITTSHDDATDRDSANPEQYAGAHLRKTVQDLIAVQKYVLAVTGLQVTDDGVLDVAFSAGRIRVGNGAPVDVSADTLTLADDDTSYVEVNAAGTVSDNTSGFSAGSLPMATVVTSGGDISSITDDRTAFYLLDASEHDLGDHGDVVEDSPADNELLAYDDGTSKWINQTPSEAGVLAKDVSAQATDISVIDNNAAALVFKEAANPYLTLDTTDTAEVVKLDKSVKIVEIAAAVANTDGYGQLWVKNTTPCELWFTDDAGADTKIA